MRPSNRIKLDLKGNVVGKDNGQDDQHSQTFTHALGTFPVDAYISDSEVQRICRWMNLPAHQLMSEHQSATHRNHDGKSSSYDMISIFGMRPPELLGVFKNPKQYFRLYSIGKKLKKEKIKQSLNWIDCLGRLVKIRMLALNKVCDVVQYNIVTSTNQTTLSRNETIIRDMNIRIRNSIDIFLNGDPGISSGNDNKKLFDFENLFNAGRKKFTSHSCHVKHKSRKYSAFLSAYYFING